ncbi:glycosyltransferase 87 family protein [Kallotenue papyrolyticum]|uniref:glycosyltransferase 87 family protein n=1 Tax=Kallotenue papyrolyticum TaxID=1325125 RepID=UPI000492C394|nr:glycosyltransferase 87 family protein [Kallotenue papyrolyticum]
MFDQLRELFQIDWRIFMEATATWLRGGNPYGRLSAEFSAGAFAYPPTALTWLALFVPLGRWSYYLWTALTLLGWWLVARRRCPEQIVLLLWSPIVLHLVEGQNSLAVVLVVWAASLAPRRGWGWGLALAWALTKPQVALLPVAWLLWRDRRAPTRATLWGGLLLGTLLLALPPTLRDPGIWQEWLAALGSYRDRILQMAAWQNWGIVLFVPAAYLWYRSRRGGWPWWLTAALMPHTSFYSMVALLPMLRPRQDGWTLAGLALAGVLQGPMSPLTLPLILSGHLLAAWMLAGGPRRVAERAPTRTTSTSVGHA